MPRSSLSLVVPLSFAFILISCLTGPNINEIPSFYKNPPTSTQSTIFGVGEAKMSTLTLSRTAALSRARDDLARQVQVHIRNAIIDYAQEAGEGNNQQTLQFVETISRQVTDVTLSGARTVKIESTSDGTVFVLVSYDTVSMMEAAKESFARNETAAFAEFKADEALRRLDSELKNKPSKAGSPSKE